MKEKMKKILDRIHTYNVDNMAHHTFGLDTSITYDVLVIAPGWKPTKLISDSNVLVTCLANHSYISGYLVEKDELKIAWVQVASSASNLMDHLLICGELSFKSMVFIGAVGSLSEFYNVGDICTPSFCIDGSFANAYLEEDIKKYEPFQTVYPNKAYKEKIIRLASDINIDLRPASVYCTDSISMEYYHLDFIRSFQTDLIEMETATFYKVAHLFEVPAIALLVVSDNSTCGHPLVGRDQDLQEGYHKSRSQYIPELIYQIGLQEK
jgi:nucleoside phosphorylase